MSLYTHVAMYLVESLSQYKRDGCSKETLKSEEDILSYVTVAIVLYSTSENSLILFLASLISKI